jgi:hypothetical protein
MRRAKSRFDLAALIIGLMMLPMAAHAEMVCNAQAGWTLFGQSTIDVEDNGSEAHFEGSAAGDPQNYGFGCSLAYWFVRVPVFGTGVDYFHSNIGFHGRTMKLMDISAWLLLRARFGKSISFPNGRVVPYAGIGFAYLKLNGPLGPISDYLSEIDVDLFSIGFVGKAGLEWIISRSRGSFGGLAVFVEGRYLMGALEDAETDETEYWWGWFPVQRGGRSVAGSLSYWQLSTGIALHLGTR